VQKAATLQQKYIELLEKRVAQLEVAVKDGDKSKSDDSTDSKTDGKEGETVRDRCLRINRVFRSLTFMFSAERSREAVSQHLEKMGQK
jgi:hypothetical protein